MPYYIDGDLKITETGAILRHLARKFGLAGDNEEEWIRTDMAYGVSLDIVLRNAILCYGDNFVRLRCVYIFFYYLLYLFLFCIYYAYIMITYVLCSYANNRINKARKNIVIA